MAPKHWRDWIAEGVRAFSDGRYAEAASAFQEAAASNPNDPIPCLYLARVKIQQHVQGDESPENAEHARRAEAALRRASELDPVNASTKLLLASFTSNEDRLDESAEWYRKALALEPRNADAWCCLGAIDFSRWLRQGKPAALREQALRDFEQSVALNPQHDTAMDYLAMLLDADQWRERAADARSGKLQTEMVNRAVAPPPDTSDPDWLLRQWTSLAAMSPPAPSSPPPPLGWFEHGEEATVVFELVAVGTEPRPPRLRVDPAIQARKLITKVDPSVASREFVQSPPRFVIVIGTDGRVAYDYLIGGSSWLRARAARALRQWVYEPTLQDGKPVEVVTEVRVQFQVAGEAAR